MEQRKSAITQRLQQQLAQGKEAGDRAKEGQIYCAIGNANESLGDFSQALECYRQHLSIAKEVGDRAGEGCAYGGLGSACKGLSNFTQALEYHKQRLNIVKEGGDRAEEGQIYCVIGNAHESLGDFSQALEYYRQHLSIAKEVGDRAAEGCAYGGLGSACQGLGDFTQALQYHKQRLSVAKEVEDRAEEGRAYNGLRNACKSLGDFKQSLEYLKQYLNIAKEIGDRAKEGQIYCAIGNAHYHLGDFSQALKYYTQHLSIAKEVGDRAREGCAYGGLGIACRFLGDFKQALEYDKQHLIVAKEVGDRAGEGRACAGLAYVYLTLGDFTQALKYYERRLSIAKEVRNRGVTKEEGLGYCYLGNVNRLLRNFREATECLTQSLNIAKELGDIHIEHMSYIGLGEVRGALGDLKGSFDYYLQGLKIPEETRNKHFKSVLYCRLGNIYQLRGDLKAAKEYHKQHLDMAKESGNRCWEGCACFRLGLDYELSGSLDCALEFYRSSVSAFDGARSLLPDKDVWKVNFRDQHQHAYTALWTTLVKLSKTDEALSAAEQGRGQALTDLMELQYGLKLPSSESFDFKEIMSSIVLDVSTQIVFVALEDKKTNLWVLSQGHGVQFRQTDMGGLDFLEEVMTNAFKHNLDRCVRIEDRKPRKPAEELTRDKESDISVQLSKGNKNSLRLLHCTIFCPIAKLLRNDEIIIVPDGALCLAPFAAFLDDSSRYLSESFRIRVIPSLTSLKLIADAPEDYHFKSGALLVGDPCLKEITYLTGEPKMKQLPYAREEVRMIGEILNTTPLTGKAASKDEVLRRIGSVALVHIAAHGQPGSGQIFLAPNPARKSKYPQEDDYILKIADVRAVQQRARLVVLSCCHSGQGDVKAEGVVGIARAFLGAGARSVLVTLWAVDDEATMEFMKKFYQHLRDGKSASVSLSLAMKYLRETEKFSAVKYWAPFQLIGDDVTLNFGEIKHRE